MYLNYNSLPYAIHPWCPQDKIYNPQEIQKKGWNCTFSSTHVSASAQEVDPKGNEDCSLTSKSM